MGTYIRSLNEQFNLKGSPMKDFVVLFLVALCVTALINGLNINFSDPSEQSAPRQISGTERVQTGTQPSSSEDRYQSE
jgi:hypothetical protein